MVAVRGRAPKMVVGWREWLAITTLNIDSVKAKIDTGARTSSLHAYDVKTFFDRGAPHVSFVVCPEQRRRVPAVPCVAEVHDERSVRSSSGHRQSRYVVLVEIRVGDRAWPIELTLANRDAMGFRMLLGRQALRGQCIVDPSRSYILGRRAPKGAKAAVRKGKEVKRK